MPAARLRPPTRLAELLGAFSLFSDLADGFAAEKVLRTAILATELARREGLGEATARDVFYTTLLRYAGCVAFSHEEAHDFGAGDDISVRSVMALADVTNPARTVSDIVRGFAPAASFANRARGVARILASSDAVQRHARAQCESSIWFARRVGVSEDMIASLETLCERFDGKGAPHGRRGEAIPVAMRVSQVADIADLAAHRWGLEGAIDEMRKRAGKHLDPRFAHRMANEAHALFGALGEGSVWPLFLATEPQPAVTIGDEEASDVMRAFAHLADLKSVYFAGHSRGVATLCRTAAASMHLDEDAAVALERAACLHDVGRAAIANAVWDKPGPLDSHERERVESHAYFTSRILRRAPGLADVTALAAAAHERCDGSGYPHGDGGKRLELPARLLAAADVLAALLEPRPHRAALDEARARDVLAEEVRTGRLDARAAEAVLAARGLACAARTASAPCGLSDREVEVLVLLARGKSNREIGTLLGISARTVQNHVAHVYDKIGVYSRAGATLFAVEHALVGH